MTAWTQTTFQMNFYTILKWFENELRRLSRSNSIGYRFVKKCSFFTTFILFSDILTKQTIRHVRRTTFFSIRQKKLFEEVNVKQPYELHWYIGHRARIDRKLDTNGARVDRSFLLFPVGFREKPRFLAAISPKLLTPTRVELFDDIVFHHFSRIS